MDHKDDRGTDFFLWGFGLVFGVVALADILGRLSRVLIREWPLISWGLAILFMTGAVIWVAIKFNAALAKHVAQVEEKIRFHENRLRGMDNEIDGFEKRLSAIDEDIRAHRSDAITSSNA